MMHFAILLCLLLGPHSQDDVWGDLVNAVQTSLPRTGRVLLHYKVVDDGVTGEERIGIDFADGTFVRLHAGAAFGQDVSGRTFAGDAVDGVEWTQHSTDHRGAAGVIAAPMELLRAIIERPEIVDSVQRDGTSGFKISMTVLGGLPGSSESDFAPGVQYRPESWILHVGDDGRIRELSGPISRRYEYGQSPWPTAYEVTSPARTVRWELISVSDLPPDAISPQGAKQLLERNSIKDIQPPTDETDMAEGRGSTPEGYERNHSRRWSLALILGGVLVLVLGGGVLVRKRHGAV